MVERDRARRHGSVFYGEFTRLLRVHSCSSSRVTMYMQVSPWGLTCAMLGKWIEVKAVTIERERQCSSQTLGLFFSQRNERPRTRCAILDDEKKRKWDDDTARCTRPDFNERRRRGVARWRDDLNSPVHHSMSSSNSFVFFFIVYLSNHKRQRRKKKDAKQK